MTRKYKKYIYPNFATAVPWLNILNQNENKNHESGCKKDWTGEKKKWGLIT